MNIELINTSNLFNQITDKYPFENNKNSLTFLLNQNFSNLNISTYRTIPIEIRAIIPENVHAFIEFNSQNEFKIFHRDFDLNTEIPKDINECIWYCFIIYFLKNHNPFYMDLIAPYSNRQPQSMFPFKNLNNIPISDLSLYEQLSLKILKIIENNFK